MWTLQDCIQRLLHGELSNLAIAESPNELSPQKLAELVQYTNEGLLRLYTRFIMKQESLFLETREGVTHYKILPENSVEYYRVRGKAHEWNSPFIMDNEHNPYTGDLIRVLEVYTRYGQQLPLNDRESRLSLFTPQYDVLQVPFTIQEPVLSLEYQAAPPVLRADDLDGEIRVPAAIQPALTAYVAGKVFTHMNTPENTHKGLEHMNNFELLCQEAADLDILQSSIVTTNTRFERGGWI